MCVDPVHMILFCVGVEVARRGTVVATLTPRMSGIVGRRRRVFKTFIVMICYDVVFLFLKSPSRRFGFSSRPVSVQVIGAWLDEDFCVQVGLEVIWFHEHVWLFPVF